MKNDVYRHRFMLHHIGVGGIEIEADWGWRRRLLMYVGILWLSFRVWIEKGKIHMCLKSLFLNCLMYVWLFIVWVAVQVLIQCFWVYSGKVHYSIDDDCCSVVISIELIAICWANGLFYIQRLPKRSTDFDWDRLILLLGIGDSQHCPVRF
jgi:hypothetical protein